MLYPLFCRIHTDDTKEQVMIHLRSRVEYQKIIIASEVGNRSHYHLLIMTTEENKKNAKQNLRNLITKIVKEGNSGYAITDTTTGTSKYICTYSVKDGDFIYFGFDDYEIEKYKRASYKKFDKQSYTTAFNKLQTDWLLSPYGIETYITDYIQLKHSYNHSVSKNIAENHFTMMLCRKDPRFQRKYINFFIEGFNFYNN